MNRPGTHKAKAHMTDIEIAAPGVAGPRTGPRLYCRSARSWPGAAACAAAVRRWPPAGFALPGRGGWALPASGQRSYGRTERPARSYDGLPVRALLGPSLLDPGNEYGSVIYTGIRSHASELVFYVVHIHKRQLPHTTFGIMGGYVNAVGRLADGGVSTSEFSGSDVAPGFHAVEGALNGPARVRLLRRGPATKITGHYLGQTIQASLAHWSVNHRVVIFWFRPHGQGSVADVTGLRAVSAGGRPPPRNSSGVGHG